MLKLSRVNVKRGELFQEMFEGPMFDNIQNDMLSSDV